MEKLTYNARVSIRTGNPTTYCISVPKEIVENGTLPLGTQVTITLKKIEIEGSE